MVTDGIKTANQVQFQKADGTPSVPIIGNKGLLVEIGEGELDTLEATTLYANVMTANTEEQTIGIGGKKVTEIEIANFSDEAKATISVDESNFVIGPGIATTLLINKTVTTVGISATVANTDVQYVIKGVE